MVVDTSALVAILLEEPERARFDRAIEADPVRLVTAATLVETALVIDNRHDSAVPWLSTVSSRQPG